MCPQEALHISWYFDSGILNYRKPYCEGQFLSLFSLRLETSLGSLHCLSLRIHSLIPFPSLIRSSISLVAKSYPLDRSSGPLGPVWSHALSRLILQRSPGTQVSTRILGLRDILYKTHTQNLTLEILSKPFLESLPSCLPRQASHNLEPLLWIGFQDHPSPYHWSIHFVILIITGLLPSVKVRKE